jgi:hypothetical protein
MVAAKQVGSVLKFRLSYILTLPVYGLLGVGRGGGVDWCCCSGGVNDRHTVRLVDVRAEG